MKQLTLISLLFLAFNSSAFATNIFAIILDIQRPFSSYYNVTYSENVNENGERLVNACASKLALLQHSLFLNDKAASGEPVLSEIKVSDELKAQLNQATSIKPAQQVCFEGVQKAFESGIVDDRIVVESLK